jgi:hypothetical protein
LWERGGTSEGRNGSACNLWAFCGDKEKCEARFGECWLKRDKALKPPPALPERAQKSEGWISGAVYENDTHVSGLQCVETYHKQHAAQMLMLVRWFAQQGNYLLIFYSVMEASP